jgi:GTP-binding protein
LRREHSIATSKSAAGGASRPPGSLIAAVHRPADWPSRLPPSIAFGGRSNVGKSTLLNLLIGSRAARTSKTPGRTQGIYLYDSGEGWAAADLPGFGFAKASRESRSAWSELAGAFFREHPPHLTVQLIDPRINTSDYDLEFRDYLHDLRIDSVVVATKADRLSQSDRSRSRKQMEKDFGPLLFVSAKTGEGIEILKKKIRQALAERERE